MNKMNTKKVWTSENIRFVLYQPTVIPEFLLRGKVGAYREALKKLFEHLSTKSDIEIKVLLEKSKSASSVIFPKKMHYYKNNSELTPLVMLYYIVRTEKPQVIIETGVWTGKTSWAILQALNHNESGHLISIDLGEKISTGSNLPTNQIGGFIPQKLRQKWTLKLGDAKVLLPNLLEEIESIDIFYHDSDHSYEHMKFEFTSALRKLKNKGIICSDDINMNSAWNELKHSLAHHYEIDEVFGFGYK